MGGYGGGVHPRVEETGACLVQCYWQPLDGGGGRPRGRRRRLAAAAVAAATRPHRPFRRPTARAALRRVAVAAARCPAAVTPLVYLFPPLEGGHTPEDGGGWGVGRVRGGRTRGGGVAMAGLHIAGTAAYGLGRGRGVRGPHGRGHPRGLPLPPPLPVLATPRSPARRRCSAFVSSVRAYVGSCGVGGPLWGAGWRARR